MLRGVYAAPEYRWREARSPVAWAQDLLQRLSDALDALYRSHPGVFLVVVVGLLAVALALLVHVSWVVWRAVRRAAPGPAGQPAQAAAPRDARWHAERARALGAQGRYAEAMGHRYVALVLQLAKGRAVTFHPSKTPGEYAAEARLDAGSRAALGALTATLYAHLFGGAPCDAGDWSRFEQGAAALAGAGAGHGGTPA